MGLIWMLFIGFIVGAIARAIKPGADSMGWIMTIILGIAGSLVGGWIASMVGLAATRGFGQFVVSIIGAVVLLFLHEMIRGKRRIHK